MKIISVTRDGRTQDAFAKSAWRNGEWVEWIGPIGSGAFRVVPGMSVVISEGGEEFWPDAYREKHDDAV